MKVGRRRRALFVLACPVQAAVPMDSRASLVWLAELLRQANEECYLSARLTFPRKFTFYSGVGARMGTGAAFPNRLLWLRCTGGH